MHLSCPELSREIQKSCQIGLIIITLCNTAKHYLVVLFWLLCLHASIKPFVFSEVNVTHRTCEKLSECLLFSQWTERLWVENVTNPTGRLMHQGKCFKHTSGETPEPFQGSHRK